jgi:hypothetical protein
MKYLWRPSSKNFGEQQQILTNVFKYDYCFPENFFSGANYNADEPFVADKTLTTFNADKKMIDFVNWV